MILSILIFSLVIRYGSCQESIFRAAATGHLELVQEILLRAISVDSVDSTGKTALYHAAYANHRHVVDNLLQQGSKLDVRESEQGWTALIAAASQGNHVIVRELLKHKADCDVLDKNGQTATWLAAFEDQLPILEELVAGGCDVNKPNPTTGSTPQIVAAEKGNGLIIQYLYTHGADINAVNNEKANALHMAVQNDHVDSVVVLLQNKDININAVAKDESTALFRASLYGHEQVLKALLRVEEIYLNSKVKKHVPFFKSSTMVKGNDVYPADNPLVSLGKWDFNAGSTPFIVACHFNRLDIVKMLVKAGADTSAKDIRNKTGLMRAVEGRNNGDVVNYLMERKTQLEHEQRNKEREEL